MLRRTKAEVEKDLPPKSEKILRVGMSPMQKEIYKHVFSRNYHALNEKASKGQKATLLNITMELRKVANHPFLMHNVEDTFLEQFQGGQKNEDVFKALVHSSGKMVLLDRLLTKLKEEGHRVLIFTQLVSMLNIIDDYLNSKGFKHQRLDGTVSSVARRQAIDHFNKAGSDDFCFILSTRAGGLGINLATADRVILFDSDWNPHPDVQAMARAHRIGQTKPVEVYRFVSENTIEEKMLTTARNKLMLEYLVIQTGGGKDEQEKASAEFANFAEAPQTAEDMERILKQQAADIFKDDNTDKTQNLDIDAILASAEEHKTTTDATDFRSSDGGLDFMKAMITSVSYDGSWESIIPKEKVEEIEREEKRRQEEERVAELQGKVRKRKAPAVFGGEHQREAKRRAKKLAAAQDNSDSDALSEPDDESDSEKDPNRPLSDKEWRLFIKAIEKHGAFNDYDASQKIQKEGGLEGRALEVLNAAYEELVGLCKIALDKAIVKANEAGKPRHEVAKKERGAVLFKHHSSNRPLNVETILERAIDMRVVRAAVTDCDDIATFRVPDVKKGAKYTCEWAEREDAMLVVGIARHGFGAWVSIRDDEELGLKEKMFLEENRTDVKKQRAADEKKSTPGAIHLHRRATYLIGVLRDREEAKQNGEAPPRKKKAPRSRVSAIKHEATENGSPAPHSSHSRPRSSSQSTPKPLERPDSRASNGSEKNGRKAEAELDRIPKKRRISDDGHDRHKSHEHARRPDEKREHSHHNHKSDRRDRSRSPHRRDRDHRDRSRSAGRRDEYRQREDLRKYSDNAYRDERRRHYDRDRHDRDRHDRDRHDRRHDNGYRPGSREETNGHRSHHDRPASSSHRDRHDHRHDHRSSHNGDRHREKDDRHRHKDRRDDDRPRSITRAEKYLLKSDSSRSLLEDIRSGMTHMSTNSKSSDPAVKEAAQVPLQKAFYAFDQFMKGVGARGDAPPELEFW
jgi:chromodomain-helicase-DNA-binding protein 1